MDIRLQVRRYINVDDRVAEQVVRQLAEAGGRPTTDERSPAVLDTPEE